MRITPIVTYDTRLKNNFKRNTVKEKSKLSQNSSPNNFYNPYYFADYLNKNKNIIYFLGKKVHIVDGGAHAQNMKHFANAISKDMDLSMHEVETNPTDENIKQLQSLKNELKKINSEHLNTGEYIAIPALASVPILNLQDQYNKVMGENKKFTPENIKANKKNILTFLEKIYNNPVKYSEYIGYMDSSHQGIEYVYGVIQEINKLIKKGINVYIPSGHPQDDTLKWLAKERGLNQELYHFIATGKDKGGQIAALHKEIKDKNWYDFNLLSLSEAHIVGVKEAKGAQDYMFAAYDSCITDGARGVYNFSPVRQDDKIIGYSYTNTYTNEYPYNEFPSNDKIANLNRFVGKKSTEVIASEKEHKELLDAIKKGTGTETCADKLYLVKKIFSEKEIAEQKINLQGNYVDRSLKLFFDSNQFNEIIFPKCDCEGSGKPSVLSMWGSCFAVFNAIARDIRLESQYDSIESNKHYNLMQNLKIQAKECLKRYYNKPAEDYLNHAIEMDKSYSIKNPEHFLDFEPYYLLGNYHLNNKNYDHASSCYNNSINLLSKEITQKERKTLATIKKEGLAYLNSKKNSQNYDTNIKKYNSKSPLAKLFSIKPAKPDNYNKYKGNYENYELYEKTTTLVKMFEILAQICKNKKEYYPAQVCEAAAQDIKNCTQRGDRILELRAQNIQYIGNLYPEITGDI